MSLATVSLTECTSLTPAYSCAQLCISIATRQPHKLLYTPSIISDVFVQLYNQLLRTTKCQETPTQCACVTVETESQVLNVKYIMARRL